MMDASSIVSFASPLDHPEGVVYAPDGYVYATGEAGQVYRVDLGEGVARQIASTGGIGLGLAADADSNLYVCDMGEKAVKRIDADGGVTTYSRGAPGEELRTPNFPVFDALGNLFVSDSGSWGGADGCVQRIGAGGGAVVWSRSAAGFTNGLAMSPDDRFLYVVESNPPAISRIQIQEDGSAGAYEVVLELPRCVPDGIAFDIAGNLYIACYAPDRIYRLTPTGRLDILLDDWARMRLNAPTNVAFAGPGLDCLVIASLGGRSLSMCRPDARGAALHHPVLAG